MSKSDKDVLKSADLQTTCADYECLWNHAIEHINRRISEIETICTKLDAFREKHWKQWKIETAGLMNLVNTDDEFAGKKSDE